MKSTVIVLLVGMVAGGCCTHQRRLQSLRDQVNNQDMIVHKLELIPCLDLEFSPDRDIAFFLTSFHQAATPIEFVYRGSREQVSGLVTNVFGTWTDNLYEAVQTVCREFHVNAIVEEGTVVFVPVSPTPKPPKPSDEEEELFQNQNELSRTFLKHLGVAEEEAMREANTAIDAFQKDFYEFKQKGNFADDNAAYETFMRGYGYSPNIAWVMGVFESWGSYEQAEQYFCLKMMDIPVSASNAYETLVLSHKHRTNMGTLESKLLKRMHHDVHYGWDDSVHKHLYTLDNSAKAQELVKSLLDATRHDSYARKLIQLVQDDLHQAKLAAKCGAYDTSYQWAYDAVRTSKSAEALWTLEKKETMSNNPNLSQSGSD